MDESSTQEEIEVLQSIYLDDLTVHEQKSQTVLEITLHPATADNREERYVCMTLQLTITEDYPAEIPRTEVKNPRGISDAHLTSILENAKALAEQRIGEAMLFELIEYAKDCLTNNNRPSCVCTICLEHFSSDDDFTRTDCYHYFHSYCLKEYVSSVEDDKDQDGQLENRDTSEEEKQLLCPVCRLAIEVDMEKLSMGKPPQITSDEAEFIPTEWYRNWKKEMETLYERQRRAGGIIDIEAERNKYLIASTDRQSTASPTLEALEDLTETNTLTIATCNSLTTDANSEGISQMQQAKSSGLPSTHQKRSRGSSHGYIKNNKDFRYYPSRESGRDHPSYTSGNSRSRGKSETRYSDISKQGSRGSNRLGTEGAEERYPRNKRIPRNKEEKWMSNRDVQRNKNYTSEDTSRETVGQNLTDTDDNTGGRGASEDYKQRPNSRYSYRNEYETRKQWPSSNQNAPARERGRGRGRGRGRQAFQGSPKDSYRNRKGHNSDDQVSQDTRKLEESSIEQRLSHSPQENSSERKSPDSDSSKETVRSTRDRPPLRPPPGFEHLKINGNS